MEMEDGVRPDATDAVSADPAMIGPDAGAGPSPLAVAIGQGDMEGLRDALLERLHAYRRSARANPLENPVQRLAHEIVRRMEEGLIDLDIVEGLVQHLTLNAFQHRANWLGAYVGPCDPADNRDRLTAVIERLARDPDGTLLSFEAFAARLQRAAAGIVVTAHPTFGLSPDLGVMLAELAGNRSVAGKPLTAQQRTQRLEAASRLRHGPPDDLTLLMEQDESLKAIGNLQAGLRTFLGIALDQAAKHYPDRWTELVPQPVTVASWVGYDLDGRADIRWSDTFRARMKVASLQIERYLQSLGEIAEDIRARGAMASGLDPILRLLESRLQLARRTFAEEMGLLPDDPTDANTVAAFSRHLAESRSNRLNSARELIDLLGQAISLAESDGDKRSLAVLRAEMATYGLGMAHSHLRLNASQLINAVRKQVGLESAPDDLGYRRRYLQALNGMLETVRPAEISFGSIMMEPTSARRMVMLVAQMLKYVDLGEPIRFLIAECESAFIVLSGLYLMRLFGIDHRVDISPLFETPEALEHGHDMIAELLENPHYRTYVKRRKRLSIQTGYSDAGRYMGQTAACLAIERLRMKVAPMLAADDLKGVELLIFDTHGESIGRGAHPASFADRLAYISPPRARATFSQLDVPVKQEISLQGGDGYLLLGTPDIAFATLTRLVEGVMTPPDPVVLDDPFYNDTDWALEFFITVKRFNERLIDDPDYAALLSAFSTNLLPPTGSRMVKRQHEARSMVDQGHPSQIRAIPHNGILQQLGLLANSVGGLGRAVSKDRDRFADLWRQSDRLRRLTKLVTTAYDRSSMDAFGAYAKIFDPVDWLRRAYVEENDQRREQMLRLARLLEETGRSERLKRIVRQFLHDAVDFNRGVAAIEDASVQPTLIEEQHPDLALLHAVRIALIEEIFLLITRIPRFSSQPDVTIDEVVTELMQLDVPRALTALRKAFPRSAPALDMSAFGEASTYQADGQQSYAQENAELFDPIDRRFDLIRRVSAGVVHIVGGVG